MGISRDSRHKRRATGGRMPIHKKKRAFEKGRPAAMTKLTNEKRVRRIRVRGGNYKFRALRLNEGNFTWASEGVSKKTKILDCIYHASNNELVRTKTLTKGSVVQIDAAPFRQWYTKKYGVDVGLKKTKDGKEQKTEKTEKKSGHVQRKLKARQTTRVIDHNLEEQFVTQRVLAQLTSRPGQSGRADGVLLEGKELEFYIKRIDNKKK